MNPLDTALDFDFHTAQPNTAGYPIDLPAYDSSDVNYDNRDYRVRGDDADDANAR